jgi:hypothetical protein
MLLLRFAFLGGSAIPRVRCRVLVQQVLTRRGGRVAGRVIGAAAPRQHRHLRVEVGLEEEGDGVALAAACVDHSMQCGAVAAVGPSAGAGAGRAACATSGGRGPGSGGRGREAGGGKSDGKLDTSIRTSFGTCPRLSTANRRRASPLQHVPQVDDEGAGKGRHVPPAPASGAGGGAGLGRHACWRVVGRHPDLDVEIGSWRRIDGGGHESGEKRRGRSEVRGGRGQEEDERKDGSFRLLLFAQVAAVRRLPYCSRASTPRRPGGPSRAPPLAGPPSTRRRAPATAKCAHRAGRRPVACFRPQLHIFAASICTHLRHVTAVPATRARRRWPG